MRARVTFKKDRANGAGTDQSVKFGTGTGTGRFEKNCYGYGSIWKMRYGYGYGYGLPEDLKDGYGICTGLRTPGYEL